MSRRTWTRDTLHITYGNPSIQPFSENLVNSIKDVMYFYYDIDILDGKKSIFGSRTHDCPKVQNLPNSIDHMINMEEKDMFLYEDYKDNGFHRKKYYNFIVLDDDFGMDCEYFYKIEKLIMYVKQSDEDTFKRYEEYTLTIGECEINKKGYSNGEPFGKEIFIKYLKQSDLLRLKQTAIDFCNVAIEEYNKYIKKYKIKCPHCNEKQLFLNLLIKEDEFGNQYFKCSSCHKDFTNNDGIYID